MKYLFFILIFLSCSQNNESKKDSVKKTDSETVTWESGIQILNDEVSNGGTELEFPIIQGEAGSFVDVPLKLGFKETGTIEVFSLSTFNPDVIVNDGASCFLATYQREESDPISYCNFILRVNNIQEEPSQYQLRLLVKEDNTYKSKFFTFYTRTGSEDLSGGEVKIKGLTSSDPMQVDFGTISSDSTKTLFFEDKDDSDGAFLNLDLTGLKNFRLQYSTCSSTGDKCLMRLSAPYPNPNGLDSADYAEFFFINGQKIDLLSHYVPVEVVEPTDSEKTEVSSNVVEFEEVGDIQTTTLTVKNSSNQQWGAISISDIPANVSKIYDSCTGTSLSPGRKCIIRLSFNNKDYSGDGFVGSFLIESVPYHIQLISIQKGDYTPAAGVVEITHLDNIDLSSLGSAEFVEITESNQASFNVKGTCSALDQKVEILLDSEAKASLDCVANLFDGNIDLSTLDYDQYSLMALNYGGTPNLKYIVKKEPVNQMEISPSDRLKSNRMARAVIDDNGKLFAWGTASFGGDLSDSNFGVDCDNDGTKGDRSCLDSGIVKILNFPYSMAALNSSGEIIHWGNVSQEVPTPTIGGIVDAKSFGASYLALDVNGHAHYWGESRYDPKSTSRGIDCNRDGIKGDDSCLFDSSNKIVRMEAIPANAFVILKEDGSLYSWGDANGGGDTKSLSYGIDCNNDQVKGDDDCLDGTIDVTDIKFTDYAVAIVNSNKEAYSWGDERFGGSNLAVSPIENVEKLFNNSYTFTTLDSNGALTVWGADGAFSSQDRGQDISAVYSDLHDPLNKVVDIFPGDWSYAALREDGSLITWGNSSNGGDSSSVSSEIDGSKAIKKVVSNNLAFAVLFQDGTLATWGHSAIADLSITTHPFTNDNVIDVFAGHQFFAGVKSDGSLITWGNSSNGSGADMTTVENDADGSNGAILYLDLNHFSGSFITDQNKLFSWGFSTRGGDSSSILYNQ